MSKRFKTEVTTVAFQNGVVMQRSVNIKLQIESGSITFPESLSLTLAEAQSLITSLQAAVRVGTGVQGV
jgi:hypothetical protein